MLYAVYHVALAEGLTCFYTSLSFLPVIYVRGEESYFAWSSKAVPTHIQHTPLLPHGLL